MADITPRVNGARMNQYVGHTVRLICKVTKVRVPSTPDANGTSPLTFTNQIVGNTAVVEASDGATVEVTMTPARNL